MVRLAVLLVASAALAAPVPEPGKAAKERAAVLAELGLPDKGQKLPAVPAAYLPDAAPEDAAPEDADRAALRAACRAVAKVLKAHRESPFHDTLAGGGSLDRVKAAIRKAQVEVARRTVDLTEALDDLSALAEKVGERETSPRRQVTSRLLVATARQELAALNEYNLALGHIITETVQVPAEAADALKLEAVPKMRSNRANRELAAHAAKELAAVANDHPNTPWAVLATEAGDRHVGLAWVPVRSEK